MNNLHLLATGEIGGIEILLKNYCACSTHNNIFVFAYSGGAIADEIEKLGHQVIMLDARHEGYRKTIERIKEICKSQNIDVVITCQSAPLLRFAAVEIKKKFPAIKTIFCTQANAADMDNWGNPIKNLLSRAVHTISVKNADGVIAVSNSVKKSLVNKFRVRPSKITVIYNGVPIEKFKVNNSKKIEKSEIELIYVGRLIKEKGVQNTLHALASISKNNRFHFTVVGDGSYRHELEMLAKNLGIDSQVSFIGTRSDVRELLSEANIFIHLPEWEEGFGIAVIEAMANGLVCICGNKGALPEIIENGVNGFLVDSDDWSKVAEMIEKISIGIGTDEIDSLRNRAIERAEEFSIEKFTQQLDTYINKL